MLGGSEPGTGSTSAAHSSAEAASAEASASTEATSASEDEGTSATSTPSAVILVVGLLAAHHLMAAVATGVGHVFRPHAVAAGHQTA